jgi:hypothetical protein
VSQLAAEKKMELEMKMENEKPTNIEEVVVMDHYKKVGRMLNHE